VSSKKSIVAVCHGRRSDLHFEKKLGNAAVPPRTPTRKQQANENSQCRNKRERARVQHQLEVLQRIVNPNNAGDFVRVLRVDLAPVIVFVKPSQAAMSSGTGGLY
jgi:hypothetical protein